MIKFEMSDENFALMVCGIMLGLMIQIILRSWWEGPGEELVDEELDENEKFLQVIEQQLRKDKVSFLIVLMSVKGLWFNAIDLKLG